MRDADHDGTSIREEIIDGVWYSDTAGIGAEIVIVDQSWGQIPARPGIPKGADQFALLGIDADDGLTASSLPVAITVNGPGRMYFDLELVPVVVDRPREIQLVVNPGFLWRVGHGIAVGSRVGFLVNSDQTKTAQFGITPLIVKSWPIHHSFFNGYFVEGDFIFRFNRPIDGPATNPFTFNVVLGLSF